MRESTHTVLRGLQRVRRGKHITIKQPYLSWTEQLIEPYIRGWNRRKRVRGYPRNRKKSMRIDIKEWSYRPAVWIDQIP